ncbi:MAG: TOBE domain-containing protein [Rhodoferax sp.]|nr:TOBE domain-containing protein [Rhodoferax sp.]MDD5333569.1 TOBE domain-containing protein [Rhodoferax sp.]
MNQARVEQIAAPQALYFRPRTRFAAEFLGESNLFACEVQKGDDGTAFAVTVAALGIRLPCPAAAAQYGNSLLLLRPESIEVAGTAQSAPAGLLALAARIESCQFLGATTRLMLRVGETEVRVLQRTTSLVDLQKFKPGEMVQLWVDPARCHVVEG